MSDLIKEKYLLLIHQRRASMRTAKSQPKMRKQLFFYKGRVLMKAQSGVFTTLRLRSVQANANIKEVKRERKQAPPLAGCSLLSKATAEIIDYATGPNLLPQSPLPVSLFAFGFDWSGSLN